MNLKLQIASLIYSFLFGIFFGGSFKFIYMYLFYKKKFVCYINTFLFIGFMSLLYFFILQIINNGILHVYFLLLFLAGNLFFLSFYDKFSKK